MSQDEIRAALTEDARRTFGPERLEALRDAIDLNAKYIRLVLEVPLAPLGEELDTPAAPRESGGEG